MSETSVVAEGVNTMAWLSGASATIAVPVYQRHYRWQIEDCRQLLDDIRAVADGDRPVHFIGSVLATTHQSQPTGQHLILIDGQQRVTTLMLLIAALYRSPESADAGFDDALREVLIDPFQPDQTRLRPHPSRQDALQKLVFNELPITNPPSASAFEENFHYFLREVSDDAKRVWTGLQRLEHVAISLTESANPQQVFESLNSTGAPLATHELVHNYVLMGLSHPEQVEIERDVWTQLENDTGEYIDDFLRDYLILKTGRDSDFSGQYGVYTVFKNTFRQLTAERLRTYLGPEWTAFSAAYRVLLDPQQSDDPAIESRLRFASVFGTATYPIVMALYNDYRQQVISRVSLLDMLEQLESLYLRSVVVGKSRDHFAAQLCRRRIKNNGTLRSADIARRTPSDERVLTALHNREVPYAAEILQRLQGVDEVTGLELEHIFPQGPSATWSGGNNRYWADFTEPERASYRQVLGTLGNLTLLEQPLNAAASNRPFSEKTSYYRQSSIASTRELADIDIWDIDAIRDRTDVLARQFLDFWPRQSAIDETQDELVPILDVPKRAGWYSNWREEFEYVQFFDELWEIRDIKTLYRQAFHRLYQTSRDELLTVASGNDKPIYRTKAWNGQWDTLSSKHYLFMGMLPQYMLATLQDVMDELGIADNVLVKLSQSDEPPA